MDTIGLWQIVGNSPARLQPAEVAAERELEDWIVRDPALLEHGLVIVGRQVRLDGGPLDLLALDPQGRWVLIEIKRERLRREVIAQAIDYASCLHKLDPAQLRSHCDAYLKSKGETKTLDQLLAQRGHSLDSEEDGREVVIYLVGTGYDSGLERMVGFLSERAELALRVVTFSAFRDEQGKLLLAREIHETADQPGAAGSLSPRQAPNLETILTLADQHGVGGILRTLCDVAKELGLHARPYVKSIMFTPPSNRTRCLFVVWVDRQQRRPGIAKAYIAAEAFEQFFGIKEPEFSAAVGPFGYVTLDQPGADRLRVGLQKLLAPKESK